MDRQIECEIRERILAAARIVADGVDGARSRHVPLAAVDVLRRVDVGLPVVEGQVQFVPIVRPRTELKVTRLLVERKVAHVDRTAALVDRRRDPLDDAVVVDGEQLLVMLLLLGGACGTETHVDDN